MSINVWRNEDLSVQVPVRPDGKISVPLAGDVTVGNKTPEQVSAEPCSIQWLPDASMARTPPIVVT